MLTLSILLSRLAIYLSNSDASSTPVPIARCPAQSGRFTVHFSGQRILRRPPSLPYLFRWQRWWNSDPFPVGPGVVLSHRHAFADGIDLIGPLSQHRPAAGKTALGPCLRLPCDRSLPDRVSPPLTEGEHHRELELAGGRRGVEVFRQGPELHSDVTEALDYLQPEGQPCRRRG